MLERGEIAEQGPVWQVFGAPRHAATRALLQPVQHALPGDLASRLRPAPRSPQDVALVELGFARRTLPDLAGLRAWGRPGWSCPGSTASRAMPWAI